MAMIMSVYVLAGRGSRARRSGRSSEKMLRDANSAGLAKVKYSRMASDGDVVVNHGLVKRRAGLETQWGTRQSGRCFARYSAIAPTSASSLASPVRFGSRSIDA